MCICERRLYMYFSNLVDSFEGTIDRNNGKSYPLVVSDTGNNAKVVRRGESIYVTENVLSGDTNIFALDSEERLFNPAAKKGIMKGCQSYTLEDVADTGENPMVVVATKGIKIFNNIPTFAHVLFVNQDVMIVSLVYGALSFELADGRFATLQRCNDDDVDRKGIYRYFSCSELQESTLCRTKGGWDKTNEIVCPIHIYAVNKGDLNSFSMRCVYDKAYVLNPDVIAEREAYEAKIAEEKRKAEEEAKKALEAKRKADRERVAKERAIEEEKKRAEEEAKKAKKSRKRKGKTATVKRSAKAEAFLAFLNNDD